MKEAIFFCIVVLPLFGKEGSGTPVFKILVRALSSGVSCYVLDSVVENPMMPKLQSLVLYKVVGSGSKNGSRLPKTAPVDIKLISNYVQQTTFASFDNVSVLLEM